MTFGTEKTGKKTMPLPPAPGLQARLAGDAVVVTLDTGHPPEACRPRIVTIVLDDDNAAFPPVSSDHPVRGVGQQTFSIVIPDALRSAPTIAQARLGIRPALLGAAAKVKITR